MKVNNKYKFMLPKAVCLQTFYFVFLKNCHSTSVYQVGPA